MVDGRLYGHWLYVKLELRSDRYELNGNGYELFVGIYISW